MTVVIYTYPGETDSHEVFGPFESDAKADAWIRLRQNNPNKDNWTGRFYITDLNPPIIHEQDDPRIKLLMRL